MTLSELLRDIPVRAITGDASVSITGITADSRRVEHGTLFVALRGQEFDGHRFIPEAAARGAAAVVAIDPPGEALSVPLVLVDDTGKALARLAASFYRHPSRRLRLIGVTGTDGKTSTTFLTAEILRSAGVRTGHCTTVEVHDGISASPNQVGFTTPQAVELQRLLRAMVDHGTEAAVVEVSSHALATERVEGCEFDVAVFTNLAPEHLDFHVTIEEYRAQKLRLFGMLHGPRTKPWEPLGVVNADDASARHFLDAAPRARTFALESPADVRATEIRCGPDGTRFRLEAPGGSVLIGTRLLGRFNVRNWLAASAAALACGATLKDVARAATGVQPVPGRMERIDAGQPFAVYVDFAHTPQGLGAALDTVREIHPAGRAIAVFGHAGGRDTHNRRTMVAVARSRGAFFILTMDDPHREDPDAILQEMREAALGAGCHEGEDFLAILDRRAAFAKAFGMARPGDAVLLAGRGHERTIPLGREKLDFHDPTVARDLLQQMEGRG